MRMAFRATATATALALSWAAAVGCSSGGAKTHAADTATTASANSEKAPAGSTSPAASVKITQAAVNEDSDGARLVLTSNAPLLYTVGCTNNAATCTGTNRQAKAQLRGDGKADLKWSGGRAGSTNP